MAQINKKIIECGIKAADSKICEEDKIWSRYSNDKVDIGEQLAKVIRVLSKELPLAKKMRALSIGSSAEPQFRSLETAFRAGLYLLDVDKQALDIIKERIRRQCTDHVATIHKDYNKIFLSPKNTGKLLKTELKNKKVDLVTLHHSLYYCPQEYWHSIFENIYKKLLAPKSAIHAVLMCSGTKNPHTTTWLYNHFAGKCFGCHNDQNLLKFSDKLKRSRVFKKAQIFSATHKVRFCISDFAKFMAAVWMILLYPDVHKYTLKQREEITEFVYKNFWRKRIPLIQMQDHLVIYKGIGFKGLV